MLNVKQCIQIWLVSHFLKYFFPTGPSAFIRILIKYLLLEICMLNTSNPPHSYLQNTLYKDQNGLLHYMKYLAGLIVFKYKRSVILQNNIYNLKYSQEETCSNTGNSKLYSFMSWLVLVSKSIFLCHHKTYWNHLVLSGSVLLLLKVLLHVCVFPK